MVLVFVKVQCILEPIEQMFEIGLSEYEEDEMTAIAHRLADELSVQNFVPRGWPETVLPPGVPDWEQSAADWLLGCCPPDYRGYAVLRRHPSVLARFAGDFIEGTNSGEPRDAFGRPTEPAGRRGRRAPPAGDAPRVALVEEALRARSSFALPDGSPGPHRVMTTILRSTDL